MGMPPTLSYCRPATRRRRRWVLTGLAIGVAIAVAIVIRPIIARRLDAWQQQRREAAALRDSQRRFDAVAALCPRTPWFWDGDAGRNREAVTVIDQLRSPGILDHGDETIVFIVPGVTNPPTGSPEPWLCYGSFANRQFYVTTVLRNAPPAYNTQGACEVFLPNVKTAITSVTGSAEAIRVNVTVDGQLNQLEFTPGTTASWSTSQTLPTYAPRTQSGWSWVGPHATLCWQPDQTGVKLTDLPTAARTLATKQPNWRITFRADGNLAVAGEKLLEVINLRAGRVAASSQLPQAVASQRSSLIGFSPDGTRLLIATTDGLLHFVNVQDASVTSCPLDEQTNIVPDISEDRTQLAVRTDSLPYSATVYPIDWTRGTVGKSKQRPAHSPWPKPRWRLESTRELRLLDANDLPGWTLPGYDNSELNYRTTPGPVTPDGRVGCFAGYGGVCVFSTDDPRRVLRLPLPTRMRPLALALSADGRQLAVAGDAGVAWWSDLPTTRPAAP